MPISNKKAKQKAKKRRKEFRNRLKVEQEAAKIRKAENAERNRRFSGQSSKFILPEDEYLYFDASLLGISELPSLEILETLYERQFFYRLEKELQKKECGHDLTLSKNLLQGMGYKKEKIEEIIQILQECGGYCDCEVILNILGICLTEYNNLPYFELY